ncbi:hypothetical protein AX774_g7406 [Zancudomyces culisetae]|uniref:Uncharacterized protein n=1 Tax=Zancudomyces culisetae TaxID=1213189 RepID=A0A1R1PE40_ZANCU|nr:hypothetical protein AX774_g7406 [Zancudomyces culisetae]|eukprot:OMH79189.1 hypothetical protein AX774_g7406 [Zancudomyces culisetae]
MTSVTDNQALLENLLLSLLGRNGTTENVENVDPSTFVQESKSDTKKKSINEGEGEGESEDKSGDDQSEEGADSSKSGGSHFTSITFVI